MEVAVYIQGQPTTGYGFYLRQDGSAINLTGYEFTINLTHESTGATASYTVPASVTTVASFDLANVTSSATPISDILGKWTGRIMVELNSSPFNVSKDFTIVVTT